MSNLLNWPHWVVDLVEENEHDYLVKTIDYIVINCFDGILIALRISAHLLNTPVACIFCGTAGELRPWYPLSSPLASARGLLSF